MPVTTEELRNAWQRTVMHALTQNHPYAAALYEESEPELVDEWLVVCRFQSEFSAGLANKRHHRKHVEEILWELIGEEFSVGVDWEEVS